MGFRVGVLGFRAVSGLRGLNNENRALEVYFALTIGTPRIVLVSIIIKASILSTTGIRL